MKKIITLILTALTFVGYAHDPTTSAGTPSQDSTDVISIFSDSYTDVSGTDFYPNWGQSTQYAAFTLGSDNMIKYSNLNYQGINFGSAQDASAKGYLHMDIWTATSFDLDIFCISQTPQNEKKVTKTLVANQWNSIDIDLADYISQGLSVASLYQFKFDDLGGTASTIFLDNVYFYGSPAATEPSDADATPTYAADDVISLFSDAYTNVNVDTWRTGWSSVTLDAFDISGDNIKKYSSLDFVGVEATGANSIDASTMEHFNLSLWTPNATIFRVKLVDFGADNAFGGGDDKEHELVFEAPAQNNWINYHLALADFTNLTTKSNISQIIFSATPAGSATAFIDNVFFSKEAVTPTPTVAAADPTDLQANVISLFSNVYTDVTVDTWRTSWSSADLEEIQVAGNDVKKYGKLDFVGIEAVGDNSIDASGMTHFTFDAWTPDATTYRIKLVDFGADNAYGGGDDKEHEIAFENQATATWNNHKIALSDFTALTSTSNISQLIFSALPVGGATLYIDNVYFSKPDNGSVKEIAFSNFEVYPNPAAEFVKLEAVANLGVITSYTIQGINGQTITSRVLNTSVVSEVINTSSLEAGIYFLQVATEQGTYTHKLIIQ